MSPSPPATWSKNPKFAVCGHCAILGPGEGLPWGATCHPQESFVTGTWGILALAHSDGAPGQWPAQTDETHINTD